MLRDGNVAGVADRKDPFRPTWSIRSPSGQLLTVEFDRLRSHWRVTPGEYVRRQLVDALAQATVVVPSPTGSSRPSTRSTQS